MFDPPDVARALAYRQGTSNVETVPADEWVGKNNQAGVLPAEFQNPPKHRRFEWVTHTLGVGETYRWQLLVPAEILEIYTGDTAATAVNVYLSADPGGAFFTLRRNGHLKVPGLGLYTVCVVNQSGAPVSVMHFVARNEDTPFEYAQGAFA